MTFKIEKQCDGPETTIRLIGRMQAQHLPALQLIIEQSEPRIVLDLEELALVDVEAVRFLGSCRRNRMLLLHCSPYIRDWIVKEQERGT
jgi:anti-anti-sigma regulatory factor